MGMCDPYDGFPTQKQPLESGGKKITCKEIIPSPFAPTQIYPATSAIDLASMPI